MRNSSFMSALAAAERNRASQTTLLRRTYPWDEGATSQLLDASRKESESWSHLDDFRRLFDMFPELVHGRSECLLLCKVKHI